jgi:L-fuculose-phosphate aldolase
VLALADAKEQLVAIMRSALHDGLVHGTAGNAACRLDDGNVALTPTSVASSTMTIDDIVIVTPEAEVVAGHRAPTSETALHLAVLADHPEFHATLHCHATYASMFAVTGTPIPDAIEEFCIHVGGDVRVADYELTGSDELAAAVARQFADRSAVLMANHGLVVAANTPAKALDLARLVEHTAEIMWGARQLGEIVPLPGETDERLAPIYERIRGGDA